MLRPMFARIREARLLAGIAALVVSLPLAAGAARAADDLVVKYDQSELVQLSRPAAQIIVGNPSIADISVKSDRLLVVTGKTFGITNIIILDAQNNVIANQRVLVRRDEAKVVNLQRGVNRQSYNCTPQCNPSITVGDETGYFESISKASQNKMGLSERSAETGAQPSNATNNQ
ncbi:MAG: pilus assembly protein N-terminal domain-containing protein [Hyphomicrobiaceae bacterium]|nr:pilus assembly protein N-terminal domain-containing protein [Hyphomicrobiaceae bacterium]